MAKRRMLLENLIESDDFCSLPHPAQVLYLHLNMAADDDGLLGNSTRILRSLGIARKYLTLLEARGYIICFESGVVAVTHWLSHNKIRRDRYTPSRYKTELSVLEILDEAIYIKGKSAFSAAEMPQICGRFATQDSIEKERIEKDSSVHFNSVKDSEAEYSKEEESSGYRSTDEDSTDEGCLHTTSDSDRSEDGGEGERFFGTAALTHKIKLYFMRAYHTIEEGEAFIEHYRQRGWCDDKGELIVDRVVDYIDEWMERKTDAPFGTPV